MQIYNSPYPSCLDCGRTVVANEGFKAFYRSYTTQLMMSVPFQAIHFTTYEFTQNSLNAKRTYEPGTHVLSGALAGATAAAVTTPLDVCKTLLNTQESCALAQRSRAISGFSQAARMVYALQGVGGFFRGFSARVIFQMPATAISWFVYESFKHILLRQPLLAHGHGTHGTHVPAHGTHMHVPAPTLPVLPVLTE
jgi:solute carrier family 25 iron transporter 28/37